MDMMLAAIIVIGTANAVLAWRFSRWEAHEWSSRWEQYRVATTLLLLGTPLLLLLTLKKEIREGLLEEWQER